MIPAPHAMKIGEVAVDDVSYGVDVIVEPWFVDEEAIE